MIGELINRLRVVARLSKADPGTYVGRAVLMPGATAEACGVNADPGMHVTQMYSLKTFPVVPQENVVSARPTKWGILGPENALVLFLECPDMVFRFQELVENGAEPTFPTYLPHLTFFYYGAGVDPAVLGIPSAVPDIEILLGPEEVTDLDSPIFEKMDPYHDDKGRFASGPGTEAYRPEEPTPDVIMGKKIGGQSGSIDGGVYEGKDGIKRYVKFYDEPKQAINERVANEVYLQAGFKAPESVVFTAKNGKGGFASELMDNEGVLGNKYTPAESQELSRGIATDILLGNRDVLGTGGTNILRLRGGELGRIDHGGALFYRALGTPKTPEALGNLQEVEGFFNPQYDMGRLMHTGGLTSLSDVPDIREQIDQIEAMGKQPGSWEKIVADANTKAPAAYDQKIADLLRHRAGKLVQWRDTKMGSDIGYDKGLTGAPLEKWTDAPTTTEGWQNVEGQNPDIQEPKFPKSWKHASAGVIIKEPDGRVWITEPMNHYGGYKYTFPKGTQDEGLSLQQTAIKEAYEETGLKVRLTGHFGDYKRDTSIGRYYTAERVGGDPTDHGWETAKVKLVDPAQLDSYVNRTADKQIAAHINQYPAETPSVEDEKPMPKYTPSKQGGGSNDAGYKPHRSFDDMLQEYYARRKKLGDLKKGWDVVTGHGYDDSKHPKYPAGSPGGVGGQFMPTGSPDEILTHVSPGTSSGSKLYNDKVKALHAAASHPTDPVTAISNTSSYSGPTHGYAKKFIALKAEALEHAKVKAYVPPPTPPPLWTASHQQAKWNNGIINKLTAATKSANPQEGVAYISVGASAKQYVKDYKDALMKYYAKQSVIQIPQATVATPIAQPALPTSNSFTSIPTHTGTLVPVPPSSDKSFDALHSYGLAGNHEAIQNFGTNIPAVEEYKQKLLSHFGISKIEKPVQALKAELKPKAPLVIPEAPPVKPGIPEDQVKLYTDKIDKIKAAALMSDPIAQIEAIPGQSSSIQAYKNAVKIAVLQHQGSGDKEVGDIVASLKVVGKAEPNWTPMASGHHGEFAGDAWTFRQVAPAGEKSALSSYQGGGYGEMNSELRHHGNVQNTAGLPASKKIQNLDTMLEKTSFPRDIMVIRNIGNVEQLQTSAPSLVGHIVQDPAFMSSSLDGTFGAGLPVRLKLNVPKGSKALYLTSSSAPNSYEKEVLIARRSLFRIDKVEYESGSYYSKVCVIHATLLPRHLQPKN